MENKDTVNVLIVEDQEMVRDAIRLGLRIIRKFKFEFVEAGNGLEGIDILKSGFQPDVIISDLMMPEMDGFAFITAVKQEEAYQHIPLLILSAKTSGEDIARALKLGAIDYLFKPFEYSDLSRIERGIEIGLLLKKADKMKTLEEQVEHQKERWDVIESLEVLRVFQLQKTESILALCSLLALYFPEKKQNVICMGLNEIILNAVTHGNLELSSAIKSEKNGNQLFEKLINEREQMAPYKDRIVTVELKKLERYLHIVITDQGHGFDPGGLQDPAQNPECLLLPYGRGIAMTKFAFDAVEFNFPEQGGTEVTLVKNLVQPE
ncbi:MAG: response regulator [SAR324 cluster bacterium]|nr:response regulator [SAR324 cluster bacterium]